MLFKNFFSGFIKLQIHRVVHAIYSLVFSGITIIKFLMVDEIMIVKYHE